MRLLPQPVWLLLGAVMVAVQTDAIALSNFSPKITSPLSSACSDVYNEQIPGCTTSDFASNSKCSTACLNGLVQINSQVQSSCANDQVSETSVIGLFQQGKAIQVLCNVAVVTTTTGSTPTSSNPPVSTSESIGESTMQLSTMVAPSNSIMTDTAMPTPPTMSTPSSASTMATVVAPSSNSKSSSTTSTTSTKSTSSSSTKTASSTQSTSQNNNGGNTQSGGGSPFDNTTNSLAIPAFSWSSATAILSIALGIILLLR